MIFKQQVLAGIPQQHAKITELIGIMLIKKQETRNRCISILYTARF